MVFAVLKQGAKPKTGQCAMIQKFCKQARRRNEFGTPSRSSLPALPQGRAEAVPKRPAMFYGEVRHRKAQLRSGAARPVPPREKAGRLRPAIARKTKSQAHLRIAGTPIPQLRGKIRARPGTHGRKPH